MTSIFENTSSNVIVHILHDKTLSDENKHNFIRTAEKYHQGLNFIDMSKYTEKFTQAIHSIAKSWTIGVMYRLFIPDVLPHLEKVIYFDCDVLVNLDISELWNVDLENKSLAAVLDEVPEVVKPYSTRNLQIRLLHANTKTYINSGVLVMNLQKIHTHKDFSTYMFEWMTRYAYLLPFPDQDALNAIFSGDIKILDSKFNVYKLTQDLSESIIHMWRSKPWLHFHGAEHERLYWTHYLSSAWGDNTTPQNMMLKLSEIALRSYTKATQSPPTPPKSSLAKFLQHYTRETRSMLRLLLSHIYHSLLR